MKNKIKTVLAVLLILSAMTTAVNAGNIGPAITNTVTTLTVTLYQATIAITSPASDSARYGSTNINVGYTTTNVTASATTTYTFNGVPQGDVPSNPFTVTGVDNGLIDGGTLNNVTIVVSDPTNGSASAFRQFLVDITAPGPVTGIANTKGTNFINWTWNNPTNSDFNNTRLNVTSGATTIVSDVVLPKTINYYNATGLNPNTDYTISIRTEDNVPAPLP